MEHKKGQKRKRFASRVGAVAAAAMFACVLAFVGAGVGLFPPVVAPVQSEQNGMTYRMPNDDAADKARASQAANDSQTIDTVGRSEGDGEGASGADAETAADSAPTGTAADQVPAAYREVVQSGASNSTPLESIPASSFEGFIVQSAGSDAARAALDAAAQAGAVQLAYNNTYYAESLEDLAQYVDASQLEYVEPNYYMQLMDVEGEEDAQVTARTKAAVFHALVGASPLNRRASVLPKTGDGEASRLVGGTISNPAPGWPPNDPYYTTATFTNGATMDTVTLPGQWYLSMTNVRGAWEHGLDGQPYYLNGNPVRVNEEGEADPVRVAVIDTGLYGTGSQASTPHEDFDYTHVAPGKSFVSEDATDTADTQHHGTAVTGFIAAVADNEIGIAGIAPGVTVIPVKVTDVKDNIPALIVARALNYSVDEAHADVINISIGGAYENDLQSLSEACQHAIDAGAIVVASGGNAGSDALNYPAAYDGVIGVGWVNDRSERDPYSNYGSSNITVMAPGRNVLTTNAPTDIYANDYVVGSGSSFAAPQVAALAAMCKAVYPEITASVFKSFLATYATDLGDAGRDDYYGYGLVNIGATAKAVRDSQILPWYQVAFNVVDQNGNPIDNARVSVTAATNIDWDANADANPVIEEPGSLAMGDTVIPLDASANTFRLHCGTYSYAVSADGHYAAHGTFTTHSVQQAQTVQLQDAHRVTLNLMTTSNAYASDAQLVVTNGEREEQPVLSGAGTFVYDLASGSYSFALSGGQYQPVDGTFVVGEEGLTITVLACKPSEVAHVQFAFTDEYGTAIDASGVECAVLKGPNVALLPQSDGTYLLAKGHDYTLQASKFGYQDFEGMLQVAAVGDEQTAPFTLQFERNRVRFNVTDQQGVAISNVTVTVENDKGVAASPAAGDPLLFNLPMGTYSYTVRAQGYVPVQKTLRMTTEETTVDVSMRMTAQVVSIAVRDEDGIAVEGARTVITAADSLSQIAPRQNGTWLLDPGAYDYIVYAEGYEAARAQFTVELDHPLSLVVSLAAKTDEQLFAGGMGTPDDPYLIATEAQLRALANQTKLTQAEVEAGHTDAVKGCYQLLNDIALRDGAWTPIGNRRGDSYIAFSGYFDGAGHTISGLDINSPNLDYQGLFGYIRCGRVVNLTVDGEVIGRNRVGGLVGAFECTVETQAAVGDVVMSVMYRCCSTVTVAGAGEVGGLCGYADVFSETSDVVLGDYGKAAVQECCSRGNVAALVDGNPTTEAGSVGGLFGYARRLLVYDCYSTGEVIGGYNVGGLLGNTQMGTVRTSYSSGIVAVYVGEDEPLDESHDWFVGQASHTQFTHCAYLARTSIAQTAVKSRFCGVESASQLLNCKAYEYKLMYRSAPFVSELNTCTNPPRASTAFTMGRAFPLLSWQAPEGTLLAPAPYVITQPQSNLASEAYPLDDPNLTVAKLVAETNEVGEDGTLHWQWYESEYPNGADATPIDGAEGAGTRADFTPPVDEGHRGITYYYCLFVNSVSDESSFDTVSVRSDVAAIHVRLYDQAKVPTVVMGGVQGNVLQTRLGETSQLEVQATSPDGGELTYEWYRAAAPQSGLDPNANVMGSLVEGATEGAFAPATNAVGSYYLRAKVTNTRELGNSAFAYSNWVRVNVAEWTIFSYEDLVAFRDVVNAGTTFAGHTVQLAADIVIPQGVNWTPIGTPWQPASGVHAHPFSGTFTGVDLTNPNAAAPVRKITGLYIDGDACGNMYLGLFGFVRNGTLRNVSVQGQLTGRSNVFAGLLAGYISAGSMGSSAGSVVNCGTLEGSSVEGRCGLGGLIGFTEASLECCANHANVKAWPCSQAEHDDLSVHHERMCALGGVVGYAEAGSCRYLYNAGTVEVAPSGADGAGLAGQGRCPAAVGGIFGSCYLGTTLASSYNAGQLVVSELANDPSDTASGMVLFCGTVAGYTYATSLEGYEGLYYLTPWVDNRHGLNSQSGADVAQVHSLAFMKTARFVALLNGQDGEPDTGQSNGDETAPFVDAADVQHVPYLYWEDGPWNVASDDGKVRSAEPLRGGCELSGFHELADEHTASCYQGTSTAKVVATFTPVEGGTLKVTWQRKEIGQTAQSDWTPVPVSPSVERQAADAQPVMLERLIDTSKTGVYELRARAVSKRPDSDVEDDSPAVYSPVITITVLEPTDEMKAQRAYNTFAAAIEALGGEGAISTANVSSAQSALDSFDEAVGDLIGQGKLCDILDDGSCAAISAVRAAVDDANGASVAMASLQAATPVTSDNAAVAQKALDAFAEVWRVRLTADEAAYVSEVEQTTEAAVQAHSVAEALVELGDINNANGNKPQARRLLDQLETSVNAVPGSVSAARAGAAGAAGTGEVTGAVDAAAGGATEAAGTAGSSSPSAAGASGATEAAGTTGGPGTDAGDAVIANSADAASNAVGSAHAVLRDFLGPVDAATVEQAQTAVEAREANPLVATVKTARHAFTYDPSKSQVVTAASLYNVAGAQGAVSFAKASVTGLGTAAVNAGKLSVDIATGAITLAAGMPAGTYTVRVTVTAAGNQDWLPKSAILAFTVVVDKAANPLVASNAGKSAKAFTFGASAQGIAPGNLYSLSGAQGALTYAIASVAGKTTGTANAAKFAVNATTGAVTLAASTPADTYTLKLRVSAAGNANYAATSRELTYTVTVNKAANPFTASNAKKNAKSLVFKTAKRTIAAKNLYTISKPQGALTYARVSVTGKSTKTKHAGKFTVNKKTGVLTLAASTPADTYTLKLRVSAAGNANYKPSAAKTLTYTVKVTPAANPLKAAAVRSTHTVKANAKTKKTTKTATFTAKQLYKLTNKKSAGALSYTVSVPKTAKGLITVAKKTGKLTVKKGLKSGSYKVTVHIAQAAKGNYKSTVKRVVFTIKAA